MVQLEKHEHLYPEITGIPKTPSESCTGRRFFIEIGKS